MIIESEENLNRVETILSLLEYAVDKQSQLDPLELSLAAGVRSRANLINDLLFDTAEKYLPSGGDIVVGKSRGQRHFVLPDCFVRVHWSGLRTFEIKTNRNGQTADWECSNRQLALLSGMDPDNKFWLPYVLDETYASITHAGIGLYQNGKPQQIREIDVSARSVSQDLETVVSLSSSVTRRPLVLKPAAQQTTMEVPLDGTDQ